MSVKYKVVGRPVRFLYKGKGRTVLPCEGTGGGYIVGYELRRDSQTVELECAPVKRYANNLISQLQTA